MEFKLLGKNRFSIWKNSSGKVEFLHFLGTLKSRETKMQNFKILKYPFYFRVIKVKVHEKFGKKIVRYFQEM